MNKLTVVLTSITMLSLLGACAPKSQGSMVAADIQAAKAQCFEQAQDMTNATVDPLNPIANDYFKICMRTRYNYTDEQLATIWAK